MQVHLLASLLQPLVESDCSLLVPQRKAWLQRDRLFATRMLLRHLAAAVNLERPQFTLVDNNTTDEVLMHTCHAFTPFVSATDTFMAYPLRPVSGPYLFQSCSTGAERAKLYDKDVCSGQDIQLERSHGVEHLQGNGLAPDRVHDHKIRKSDLANDAVCVSNLFFWCILPILVNAEALQSYHRIPGLIYR